MMPKNTTLYKYGTSFDGFKSHRFYFTFRGFYAERGDFIDHGAQ